MCMEVNNIIIINNFCCVNFKRNKGLSLRFLSACIIDEPPFHNLTTWAGHDGDFQRLAEQLFSQRSCPRYRYVAWFSTNSNVHGSEQYYYY